MIAGRSQEPAARPRREEALRRQRPGRRDNPLPLALERSFRVAIAMPRLYAEEPGVRQVRAERLRVRQNALHRR